MEAKDIKVTPTSIWRFTGRTRDEGLERAEGVKAAEEAPQVILQGAKEEEEEVKELERCCQVR